MFRNQLHAVFTHTSLVNVLDSNDQENLALIGRPDLGLTFTKLHAWRLTEYEKVGKILKFSFRMKCLQKFTFKMFATIFRQSFWMPTLWCCKTLTSSSTDLSSLLLRTLV